MLYIFITVHNFHNFLSYPFFAILLTAHKPHFKSICDSKFLFGGEQTVYLVLFRSPRFISLTFVSCLCLPLPFAAPLVTLPSMPRLSIAVQTVTMHELTFTMAPKLVAPKLLASRFAVQIVITHNTFCTSTKTDCIESASSTFLNNVVAQEETFLEIPKSHQH